MPHSVLIRKTGSPDVLSFEETTLPPPADGEVRSRQTAIGVNFIDTYHRTGLYPVPGGFPAILGQEGAGIVTQLGSGVTSLAVGDRVAYGNSPGAYTTERNIAADRVLKLPHTIDDEAAAAMMLKGMTAQYLLRQVFRVDSSHTVLIHAAAGGVGLIACQWAKALGANVIGTAGSEEKAALARRNGCDHVILYRDEDFVARVDSITNGRRCDVVYDGVGRATFPASLDCLRPRGMFVSFGNASGAIEAFNILLLSSNGSLVCSRPTLAHFIATRSALESTAQDLFDVVSSGKVRIAVNQRYPLRDAAQAHADLEARRTTGSTLLIP